MFHRIIAALDRDSAVADQVLAEAMTVAQASHATLNLVHVLSPLKSGYPDPAYMTVDGAISTLNLQNLEVYLANWEELRQSSLDSLAAQSTQSQAAGLTTEVTQRIGDPGREICTLAKDWQADLVVLGRRGMTGLGELLLGSVSSFVMHRAPCSVLIVQGNALGPAEPKP